MMLLLQHHILHLHQADLRASLIFIQLHRDIFNIFARLREKNLMMRAEAECGACAGKMDLAKKAKALNLDAIHDTVHEMAKDEARHGRGFEGLLKRYFNTEV